MRLIRYRDEGGVVGYAASKPDGTFLRMEGDIFGGYVVTGQRAGIAKLLAPIVPTNILCIGLNYRKHAEETGGDIPPNPILFLKATSALQNPGDPIEIPQYMGSTQVDYECELAVVIGKVCKNVKRDEALDYVLGYTCANDVSARDWQMAKGNGRQWCRGKTFDTFAPLGPCLVTTEEIPDPNALAIRTILNGQIVQEENTADMIFDVPRLIEFLSGSTTLLPGTVILTGTPSGVGMARTPPLWLRPGDEVSIEIEGIGTLTNPVTSEKL